ncbi:T9SS type A sorting domain-containing protein [Owenweeksia hongkongensis]|uniref:T9SS type A sorting domain-containing protein n=1 Tax=Owenweeksia hongkongensis TaxID=253245 RepID=UPI003A8D0B0F
MKRLLLTIAFLFSLSGNAQITTYNLNYNGRPSKILSVTGNTLIVVSKYNSVRDSMAYLQKYKLISDEYVQVGSFNIASGLWDYRFSNGKLHIVANQQHGCGNNSEINYVEIDTARFVILNTKNIGLDVDDVWQAKFLNDTSIAFWHNSLQPWGYFPVSNKLERLDENGSLISEQGDFIAPMYDGEFMLQVSTLFGGNVCKFKVFEEGPQNYWGIPQFVPSDVKYAHFYDIDSILLLTADSIVKMDTTLTSYTSHAIPGYKIYHIVDSLLFLMDASRVLTLRLPDLTIIDIDSIKGLPTQFDIVDVYPSDSNTILCVAGSVYSPSLELNQVLLKADISAPNEIERNEISMDSAVFVQVLSTTAFWQYQEYKLFVTNRGSDTIHQFRVLYNHFSGMHGCVSRHNSIKKLLVPPGETRSFTRNVNIRVEWPSGQGCFYVAVPDNRQEDNLSDNSACVFFTSSIGIEEVSGVSKVSFYPNPVVDDFHIEGDLKDLESMQLFSLDGREVELNINSLTDTKKTINLNGLPKGI